MTPYERSRFRRKLWLVAFTAALLGATGEYFALKSTGHVCESGTCVDVSPPDFDLDMPSDRTS